MQGNDSSTRLFRLLDAALASLPPADDEARTALAEECDRLAITLDEIAHDHFRCACSEEYDDSDLPDPACKAHDGVRDNLLNAASALRAIGEAVLPNLRRSNG